MLIYRNYSLQPFNTLALAAQARKVVMFDHVGQLQSLQSLLKNQGAKRLWVLGGGSNMVMADYIDALVIKVQTQGIRLIKKNVDTVIVEAQAGENWHHFVQYCLAQGWCGLENLALIPGTVGAAPVQNIGAYGVELEQRVHQVTAWDFQQAQLCTFSAAECDFLYRDSHFKRSAPGRYLITSVQFKLSTTSSWQPVLSYPDLKNHASLQVAVTPKGVFNAVVQVRQTKLPDPKVLANAGSFFKNPVVTAAEYAALRQRYPTLVAYPHGAAHYKLAAGWLIDQAGWKGKQQGAVGMHKNQALVLVNYGEATALEVNAFVDQVKADVKTRYGISLEQEPAFVA